MASLKHADSRKNMYSWWWNSHISPKNSKWLQENLTDMDVKVKSMIKLIEEDADSFARRAEMYYKKRPELMKLVEEFYRAYRALAERYDHATGALRQAHRTMAEAFPNQIPLNPDDSPAGSEGNPRTPEMSTPARGMFEHEDMLKDAPSHGAKRNGAFGEESEGRVRKGLNFGVAEEVQALSDPERGGQMEKEIVSLKEALAKLEAEKEAALVQYEQSLESLYKLKVEFAHAQKDSKELAERASRADAEAETLKEDRSRLEAEKEDTLVHYQECSEKVTTLEKDLSRAQDDTRQLNKQSMEAENEAQLLKQDLTKLEVEKDAALDQYQQSLEKISDLEKKLTNAEEDARKFSERAEKAEGELETLKQAIAKLIEEKEAEAVLYQQCLETIASLEHKLLFAQEEAERLSGEIDSGVAKLKGAEEQCVMLERSNQSLRAELESLVAKMGSRSNELTEKQKELGRLWTSIQEERLRFVEAETAFQTLQHLHSQAQEELRSLASELQNRDQILTDMEMHNQILQDKILKYKEENENLSELNLSSTMLTKDMRDEIFTLKESNGKLEEEVGLRVDQRNALQQEIYCLKEELNELNRKHRLILEQIDTVGLNPERFGSSVKELQDENSNLKEVCQRERSERLALLEKLEIMGQLLEKNAVLENSLSDLGAELEGVRGKIRVLEDSCRSLLEEKFTLADEKASLIDQLQVTTDNLGKLSEKNSVMENSLSDLGATLEAVQATIRVLEDSCRSLLAEKSTLADEKASLVDRLKATTENLEQLSEKNSVLQNSLSDAHVEIEVLKSKSKNLEDSCQLHVVEKSALVTEKGSLASEIEITQKSLKDLDIRYAELEEKCLAVERERASTLQKLEALEVSLAVQKQEHARSAQMNGMQLAGMEGQILQLKEEGRDRRKEFEEELDRGFNSQIEIFVLGRSIQDLEENNFSLVNDFQKLLEASNSSEKLIGVLEQEKTENQVLIESLSDHIMALRVQMHQLLKVFNIELYHESEDTNGQDQMCLDRILSRAEDTKHALFKTEDESKQLVVEMSIFVTLLRQLRTELTNLEIEKNSIEKELTSRTLKFLELQSEVHKVREENEALSLQVTEGKHMEEVLLTQIKNLRGEVLEVRGAYESEKNSIERELTTRTEMFLEMEGEAEKIREMNEELRSKVNEGEHAEEVLATQIDNLRGELLEVHGAYGELLAENLQVSEERKMLTKALSNADDRVHAVEEENNIFIDELYHQSILSVILKNYLDEKSAEICGLVELIDNHNGINGALLQKLRTMEREVESQQMENQDIKETLQKSEHELETVIFVRDELNCEILSGKNLLGMKERELLEAEEKLKSLENEKMALYKAFEDLKKEGDEVRMASEEQRKHILELNDKTNRLSEEQVCLREASRILELELQQLREEHEKTISELQREREEFEALESHAVADYGDLLASAISQALLGMKVRELADAFVSLQEENTSKDVNAEVLKEGTRSLEGENETLKSQVASYVSSLISLRDCIVSVENLACLQAQLQKSNEDVKGAELVNHQSSKGADEFSDLWDLQSRVKAIANSVVELERLRVQENINANTKLEAVMRQMEELELQRSYHKGERKSTSEILEVGTKDIVLDQESESSSHERSKRDGGNQMLELWETTYQDSSIDLTVGKSKRQLKPKAEDVVVMEKELGVDKLEISKRFKEPREEGNKRKVLERLNSDDQRLTNLHITVQDLKKKVETTEKNQTGKAVAECGTQKRQLEEAEEAIQKLFDLTAKLMKNIDDSSHTPDKNAANESEESKAARRKRVSEQARRISEKIGRLQLEVQKIQFVLLKLDDEQESKGRSQFLDAKRRVLLKDYLYGGGRTKATIHRKKKAPFCACMEPTTRE